MAPPGGRVPPSPPPVPAVPVLLPVLVEEEAPPVLVPVVEEAPPLPALVVEEAPPLPALAVEPLPVLTEPPLPAPVLDAVLALPAPLVVPLVPVAAEDAHPTTGVISRRGRGRRPRRRLVRTARALAWSNGATKAREAG